ncbi:unnamed protein product [Alopecurus aequalis]
MTLRRTSYSSFLFLCFHVLAALNTTSDAALRSHQIQAKNCSSTSVNYSSTGAYAANLNKFLAALPENAVSKNGGFFNGTVGEGADTVYGLAMCSADYSRADCGDCLAATASGNANGLPDLCPGSTNVVALFDPCLVRYSDTNFFGTPDIGAGPIYSLPGATVSAYGDATYSEAVVRSLKEATGNAVSSAQRFAASSTDPYTMVQCTWDLPPDQCKQCLDVLSANATEYTWFRMVTEGKRKSYSCSVRYSNTSFVVVPFGGAPTPRPVDQATASAPQSSGATGEGPHSGHNSADVVASVVGIILLACLAASIWYMLRLRSQRNKRGHVRKFTYSQLVRATGNFNEELGRGNFGAVYKGVLDQDNEKEVAPLLSSKNNNSEARSQTGSHVEKRKGKTVAVKKQNIGKSREARAAAIDAFSNEIEIMSPLNHCNIIRLVGWCQHKDNLLLVYELVENQNLETQLYRNGADVDAARYGPRTPGAILALDWEKRYNILLGIASGLEYLHKKCAKAVLHRDIKPANVMLDRNFNAKLCDFGLVTQLTHAITSRPADVVIGSIGYMDPLCQQNLKITVDSDIYSFGVLMLEVICGIKPVVIDNAKNTLIEHVRECDERNAILDAALPQLTGVSDEEIKRALLLGLRCVKKNRSDRPTTQAVLAELVSMAAKSSPHDHHARRLGNEV